MCIKDAIRQLFSADSSETSVRSQVCNVVCLLVTTIHQIYAVFYAGDGDTNQPGKCLSCVNEYSVYIMVKQQLQVSV